MQGERDRTQPAALSHLIKRKKTQNKKIKWKGAPSDRLLGLPFPKLYYLV